MNAAMDRTCCLVSAHAMIRTIHETQKTPAKCVWFSTHDSKIISRLLCDQLFMAGLGVALFGASVVLSIQSHREGRNHE